MKQFLTTLILVSLLFSIFGSQLVAPVGAEITWTVDDDGSANFSTIQAAIDAASPGDTIIVYEGTYSEGQVNIDKPLTLKANGTVIVDGLQAGHVLYVTANKVTIEGLTVTNSAISPFYKYFAGIRLYKAENCVIERNILIKNKHGVALVNSNNNLIKDNIAANNTSGGIFLLGSDENLIEDNVATGNLDNVYLISSHDNLIRGNMLVNSTHMGRGIHLRDSSRNIIEQNIVKNNDWNGIYIIHNSDKNIIRKNIVSESKNGIYLNPGEFVGGEPATDNIVVENTITSAYWVGIKLRWVENNTIIGNTVTASGRGCLIFYSNSNVFTNNLIANTIGSEIYLENSINNIFYHNNLMDFGSDVTSSVPKVYSKNSTSLWDNGYPSGGNYWSDQYHGDCADHYSGPNQDISGSDGIVDTPYVIDGSNQDNYPLMEPWTPEPSTPIEALQDLIETIEAWNLTKRTEKSLVPKLEEVIHLLDKGNENGAIHKLMDFMNQVEALREKKLMNEQADYLIAEAEGILDLIQG